MLQMHKPYPISFNARLARQYDLYAHADSTTLICTAVADAISFCVFAVYCMNSCLRCFPSVFSTGVIQDALSVCCC